MASSKLKILDAKWTSIVNILIIRCENCNAIFDHRTNRWTVHCPSCGTQGGLDKLREEYVLKKLRGEMSSQTLTK